MKRTILIVAGLTAIALTVLYAAPPPWSDNAGYHVPGTLLASNITVTGTFSANNITNTATMAILSNRLTGATIVSNQVQTFTPLYRTISLLDSTTNPVSLVICTNMPAVTACTNLVVVTIPAVSTNAVVGSALQAQ